MPTIPTPSPSTLGATLLASAAMALVATAAAAGERAPGFAITEQREACRDYTPERRAFFGDLHVHTAFSQDASTQGTRNTPRDAYRFARGERLGLQPYDADDNPLRSLKLERPLDFVAVTDHAEQLGETHICQTPGLPGHGSIICRIYRRWPRAAYFLMNLRAAGTDEPERYGFCGDGGRDCAEAALGPWNEIREAAEQAYDRSAACRLTTFVGYEWTAAPGANNLHRNVIFRNERAPRLPISYFDANTPASLRARLTTECLEGLERCDVLTIPHNSNLSGGLMFITEDADGRPLTADRARERSAFEPLIEIMQHKGDSECLPGAGVEDELCAFEKLPYSNFAGKYVSWLADAPDPRSFVRYALKQGLAHEARLGENPFRFGFVGGTDTHLGTPGAAEEDGYAGHGGAGVPAARVVPVGLPDNLEFNPGGLSVLWAEENSRDSLFAAMRRREAYGTSGPRITVRLFGGWSYPEGMCGVSSFVERGYDGGVPMGGILRPDHDNDRAPRLAVWALADPGTASKPGTPLARVQIVKGWVGKDGVPREKVFDVATSAGPEATLDLGTCETGGQGASSLCTVWSDPEYDAGAHAFYYARILENPTCRWSTRVCNARGVDCSDRSTVTKGLEGCCAPEHRRSIQERAWTSPIWVTPHAS